MLQRTADIVIIGGGVIGTSIAYHLAARGARQVLLLEREKFLGTGSTAKATGGVRYQFSTPVNIALSLYSIDILAHFEERFGVSADYRPIGYLFLLTQPGELPVFRRSLEIQHANGVPWSCWLEPDDVRKMVPLVRADDVLGATWCPRDGVADPNTICTTFGREAARRGVRIETEVEVTGLDTRSGRVVAVETNRGRVETAQVVDACGPWSAEIGRWVGLDIPVAPLRRQSLFTGPLPQFPRNHPFIIEFASSLHFRPEGDGVQLGMSNQDETPGYKFTIDEEFRDRTIACALERLPILEQTTIAHEHAGLYEMTPDHHPILSGARALEGFYVAAGFSGHGMMHSPAAGKVMSELLLDGRATTVDISTLDLERFAEGREIKEINVI